ncbi:MAG: hypothetical protein EOO54_17875, partial [Haliea sp.]
MPEPHDTPAAPTPAHAVHTACMARGRQLHAAGKPELALLEFERALAAQPGDVNAVSACATMLSIMNRPRAAYEALRAIEDQLWTTADGAANLAIAAEACGDLPKARAAYAQALLLDPQHLRALNNMALIAAADGDVDLAIARTRQCMALDSGQPSHAANLSDFLCRGYRYTEALDVLDAAAARFPQSPDLAIRRVAVLAFSGDLEQSTRLHRSLDAHTQQYFAQFLARSVEATNRDPNRDGKLARPAPRLPDAAQLFCDQAFGAMGVCNWQDNDRLTALLRRQIQDAARTGIKRDWRDAQLYG